MANWEYGAQIWASLLADIDNEIGVAALMGNLVAESGLIPNRCEIGKTDGYASDEAYTAAVDSGAVSESRFVNYGWGYGLAQWTYYSRKQGLYDMKQAMNVSIGSVELGVAYLLHELQTGYTDTYNQLVNATDMRTASTYVLTHFEQPADQGEAVQTQRYENSLEVYNTYSGTPIIITGVRKMPLWFYLKKRGF